RLNKFIAACGAASRRKADEMIEQGMVKVNGKIITELGFKIDSGKDHVKVGKKLLRPQEKVYIIMNKPEKCITTVDDEKERRTVIEFLGGKVKEKVFPVGRLDYNTTGCLFLTNDGDWANRVSHPAKKTVKEYEAKIKGRITDSGVERLKKGMKIDNRFCRADYVKLKRNDENDVVILGITSGINHQIKKMLEKVGKKVIRLKRISIGRIGLKGLEKGAWRYMTEGEIKRF
ncbi:MAG: pseudouridine synthase, partial [bacterium]